jgi:hypothetical protein
MRLIELGLHCLVRRVYTASKLVATVPLVGQCASAHNRHFQLNQLNSGSLPPRAAISCLACVTHKHWMFTRPDLARLRSLVLVEAHRSPIHSGCVDTGASREYDVTFLGA